MFLFWKKANTFHKYCPAATWLTVGAKLVLIYKVENSTFWKLTNIAICLISAAVSVTFNSKRAFCGLPGAARTTAPEENCPPDTCPLDDYPLDDCPTPQIIALKQFSLRKTAPCTIVPEENCPQGKLTPGQLPPHHIISLENNCPHSSKLPSKSTTSELKKTMYCLRVHGIIVKQKNITLIT